jgi:hypothetical protein
MINILFIKLYIFSLIIISYESVIIDLEKCKQHDHMNDPNMLEKLAYKYGTDKSHDDHKYVDVYNMLFQHYRHKVHNMTEVSAARV